VETQRTNRRVLLEPADEASIERRVRQLLADKISGNQVGIWLLVPEHLRLGSWDLLCGWSGYPSTSVHPRLAMHLVNEAAFCTCAKRRGRSLSQRGFEVANGLPWVPNDAAIHELLDAHTVAEAEALQVAFGKLRRASGHFEGKLLAIDPHRLRSWSKRQMRRHKFKKDERALKMAQGFFVLDADTREPVCFTLSSSAQTVSQATPGLLKMAAEILGPKAGSLLLADTEHYTVELLDHVHLQTPFEMMVPMARKGRHEVDPQAVTFTPRWPGYATAKEPFAFKDSQCEQPYWRYIQRCGEVPDEYTYKSFVATADRDELPDLTVHFPQRWHVEEFFKMDQALGWKRAGTPNLNIRYGQMTFALLAQAAISQMRKRLGSPFEQWDATHLAQSLFSGLEGDVRVEKDTIVVTYYNAPEPECLRAHYERLPDKLSAEGIDPRVDWLCGFKLDFHFR
jgi:hypothetical protein